MGASFTISSSKDFLGLNAAPLRRDGAPGTYPESLSWSMSPNDGSLGVLNVPSVNAGNPNLANAQFTPKPGTTGTVTITVSGEDENGGSVSNSATVNIETDSNPTSSFSITQTH